MAKNNEKEANKIIHQILDQDQFGMEQLKHKSKYLKLYNEGPVHFIPGSNRMVFWNEENVVLRVREYQNVGRSGVVGVFDYEIGRDKMDSLSVSAIE